MGQVDLPSKDLQKILEELPVTHLRDEKYWYLQTKVNHLKEKLTSLEKEGNRFSFKKLNKIISIPKPDLYQLLDDLNLSSSLPRKQKEDESTKLAQTLYNELQKLPLAERYIVKLLLKNDRKMTISKLYARVDKRTIYSLEAKNILKRKSENNVILLSWRRYLMDRLPKNVKEKTFRKIEKKLVENFL